MKGPGAPCAEKQDLGAILVPAQGALNNFGSILRFGSALEQNLLCTKVPWTTTYVCIKYLSVQIKTQ